MKLPTPKMVLLIATALCLVAQGSFALPECRCIDREALPPCHQPERSSCCTGAEELPATAGCSTAMQLSCCDSTAAPAEEAAVVPVVDLGSEEALAAEGHDFENGDRVALPVLAQISPPAPPGAPTWLLNSTLRN